MRPKAALLLLLVLLLPTVTASCAFRPPADLSRVAWAGNDRVVTMLNGAWGLYNWRDGHFQPFTTRGPESVVVSPDGAWAAWAEDEGRGWDCTPIGPALVASPVQGGAPQAVRAGEARALAASVTHLAAVVEGEDAILLYRWGEWANATLLRVDREAAYAREGIAIDAEPWTAEHVRLMRFSADGARLAIATHDFETDAREVLVVDVATGVPLPGAQGAGFVNALFDMAFDPSGERLAVLTGQSDMLTDLQVRDVGADGAIVARWLDVRAGTRVAWSRFGIAVAQTEHGLTSGGPMNGSLALFPDATLTNGRRVDLPGFPVQDVAWTNDGEVIVGLQGRLRVYNASLGYEGESTPGAPFRPAPTPPSLPPQATDAPIPFPAALAVAAILLVARRRR